MNTMRSKASGQVTIEYGLAIIEPSYRVDHATRVIVIEEFGLRRDVYE
jgi:hypothetical protein